MIKIPEFSKITEKLDLQNIVKNVTSNVKSMITPGTGIPEVNKDDPVSYRLLEIVKALQNLATLQQTQAQELAKLDQAVGALCQNLTTAKNKAAETKTSTTLVTAEDNSQNSTKSDTTQE